MSADPTAWQSLEVNDTPPGTTDADEIVAALLVQNGRVLLCHRAADRRWYPDVWDLPGGHVEDGEAPIEALARELEEEVGILVEEQGPELARVVGAGFVLRIWLVEKWIGDPVNASPWSTTIFAGSTHLRRQVWRLRTSTTSL